MTHCCVWCLHPLLLCQSGSGRCILEEPVNWADGFVVTECPSSAQQASYDRSKKPGRRAVRGKRDCSLLGMRPSWRIYFDELTSPIPEMIIKVKISVVWWKLRTTFQYTVHIVYAYKTFSSSATSDELRQLGMTWLCIYFPNILCERFKQLWRTLEMTSKCSLHTVS